METRSSLKLIISIAGPQMAGGIGSFFTSSSFSTWYTLLEKPSFNPPAWVFAPVWITLYLLMGLAVFLVWDKGWKNLAVKKSLGLFLIQLILNSLWSIIFFGFHSPFWALIDLTLLWLCLIWTIIAFYRISKPAALILLPYFAWISFAGVLNYFLWILN